MMTSISTIARDSRTTLGVQVEPTFKPPQYARLLSSPLIAPTPSDNASWLADYRDVLPIVRDEIEDRITELCNEQGIHFPWLFVRVVGCEARSLDYRDQSSSGQTRIENGSGRPTQGRGGLEWGGWAVAPLNETSVLVNSLVPKMFNQA